MNAGAAEYLGMAFFWPSPFMAELVYKLDLGTSENFWLRDEWPPSSPGLPSLCREAADDGRVGEKRVFFTHDARLPFMNTGAAEYLGTAFFGQVPLWLSSSIN